MLDKDKRPPEPLPATSLGWRAIRDNLRNFFLSPPAEMLSFLQRLREAVELGQREESAWDL
jgi:hypothetical protein